MADTETNVQVQQPASKAPSPFTWGIGRRKSAVARVRIKPGTGKILINDRDVDTYFLTDVDRNTARSPLLVSQTADRWDVFVNVNGGGMTGQAGAVMLGLARALIKAATDTEVVLRGNGMLTRDSRMKERKKYGQKGARKRFQFSKR